VILRTKVLPRRARLLVAGVTVAVVGSGLFTGAAHADPVADKQSQARALAQQIDTLGAKEAALSEQYNKTVLDVQAAQANLAQTTAKAARADADAAQARALLRDDSVGAYIHGGTVAATAGGTVDAQTAILRAAYVQTLASTQTEHLDGFRTAAAQAKSAAATLEAARQDAARKAAELDSARTATAGSEQQLRNTLSQVKGDIATEVAQIEAAKQAEAARQAQQQLARQQLAAQQVATQQSQRVVAAGPPTASPGAATATRAAPTAARSPSPAPAPVSARPAPPVGSGASAAVAAAMSRLGLPYVWAASGPNSFDCSGLTMWAWAHGGVSLPHFSGGQYASTTHISMADLQPGDLVFFADTGAHVAMYIGGGQIIAAPHTGTVVQIQPLSSAYVHASRP
jgi:cell wall-associated NlpC family hydrolase